MSEQFSKDSASLRNFEPLVDAARGGDEHAFRALIEPLARELHAYAYRMLGGFHDADDALQDAHLKAWRALATYEPRASFRAWMYRIVTNTCLDMLKTRSRRVLPQDVGSSRIPMRCCRRCPVPSRLCGCARASGSRSCASCRCCRRASAPR
jgi:hypothetical protein